MSRPACQALGLDTLKSRRRPFPVSEVEFGAAIKPELKFVQITLHGMETQMSEQEAITYQSRTYQLLGKSFWHVSAANGLIFHNAFLGKGVVPSISLTNQIPGLEDVVSPYSFKARSDEKEKLWERVRKEINEALPSRLGAFFVVESEDRAKEIAARWFAGEQRNIIKTRIVAGSKIFCADAHWLDSKEENWEEAARRYWNAEKSDRLMVEILVEGLVYFPDWENPPFGLFPGLRR